MNDRSRLKVERSVNDALDLLEKLGIKAANDRHMIIEFGVVEGYLESFVDRNWDGG